MPLASVPGKQILVAVSLGCTCLCRFQGSGWPCNLSSLMGLRKADDSSVCPGLYCCTGRSDYFRSKTRKLPFLDKDNLERKLIKNKRKFSHSDIAKV